MAQFENIALHYFSVKILALAAGFSEAEAQTIAEISQFLGDNSNPGTLATDIELPALLARGLATLRDDNTCLVTPRRTGLTQDQWFDKTVLGDQKVQREVIVPFHMLPPEPLREAKYYMTSPRSVIFDSLAQSALREATDNAPARLARAGLLAHVLFDMNSHKRMCGLLSPKAAVKLVLVRNGASPSYEDITAQYSGEKYSTLPNVGFAHLSRALDDCWLNQKYTITEKGQAKPYTTNNSATYALAATDVLNLLRRFRGQPAVSLSEELRQAFITAYLLPSNDFATLKTGWEGVFVKSSPALFLTDFRYDAATVQNALYAGDPTLEGAERFGLLTQFILGVEDIVGAVHA